MVEGWIEKQELKYKIKEIWVTRSNFFVKYILIFLGNKGD
jgi:hypothetical protein